MSKSNHDEKVKKAEKIGYRVTDTSCAVTTMARTKSGITTMLNICQNTGHFLGDHSI